MRSFPGPRLRHLVADTLGVDVEELSLDVSLTDDLAADSLDLAELVVRLETELGLVISDRLLECVRTYGDLLRASLSAYRAGEGAAVASPAEIPIAVWARLVSARGQLLRAEFLTPYAAETIAEAALGAGPGARLEVLLAEDADDATVARVRGEFAWLGEHGIEIGVARQSPSRVRSSREAA